MTILSFLLLITLVSNKAVVAFRTGAGACPFGSAAVGDPHFVLEVVQGSLADGGLELRLDGVALDPAVRTTIEAGVEYELSVRGSQSFRGALMRLEAPLSVDTTSVLVPLSNAQEALACDAPVVGVTHVNAGLKQQVSATLVFDEPAENIDIDVTIVIQNTAISEFYYSGFTLDVAPAQTQTPGGTVVEQIIADADLETLENAIVASDLLGEILATEPLTVFAPEEFAWDLLGSATVEFLLLPGAILHLQELLLLHISNTNALSSDLSDGSRLQMLNFETVEVNIVDGEIFLENDVFGTVKVDEPDVVASNGVIHKIDRVMRPAFLFTTLLDGYAVEASVFSTLLELITVAGLEETIRTEVLTILAPTNEAFAALPSETLGVLRGDPIALEQVLLFHALPGLVPSSTLADGEQIPTAQGSTVDVTIGEGSVIEIGGARVLFTDGLAKNGLAYVIDAVLELPFTVTGAPTVTASPVGIESASPTSAPSVFPTRPQTAETVVEIILNDPELEFFRDLLISAEVVEPFASLDGVSLFAPTNSAFQGLDSEFLTRMLQPEWVNHLIEIISVHIGVFAYRRRDLLNGTIIEVLNTQLIDVNVTDGETSLQTVDFNGVRILEFDLIATNGVVHKIDTVIKPLFFFTDLVQAYASELFFFATFIELITVAGLESTLRTGYYTILAPTTDAFRALPEGNVPFLREPGNEDIASAVVLNHVIEGLVPSEFLFDGDRLTVITDDNEHVILLDLTDDEEFIFRIGGADVLSFDGLASNGLGYAIASVLIPDSVSLPAELASGMPSSAPSTAPSLVPSNPPSSIASNAPTTEPTEAPSGEPTSDAGTRSYLFTALACIVAMSIISF